MDSVSLMTDSFGRRITDVRIAVNSSCNLQCIYCHREGEGDNGCVSCGNAGESSVSEIHNIMAVLSELGVRTLKITGGEPLLRPDILDVIRAIPPEIEVSMTTNGTLLKEMALSLKVAGLTRVNISIDSLHPERYAKITGHNLLSKVLEGLDAAVDAGLTPVKINTVLLPGINDDEIEDFLEFVRGKNDIILQFIELMNMNGFGEKAISMVNSTSEFALNLEERFKREAEETVTRRMHHRRKYNINGAMVEIVRPMHNAEFCANCNRLRITSDGMLKPCLLRCGNEIPLKGLGKDGIIEAIRKAVATREPYFT
ncbi:MAG TPA: GTP 3',8-cyclase MoaA [Methanocorpusculum sp.]|nr:GTP 3',8-cyclase MoaA [Methanocorpusculum sp.]HJJ40228.1 GTP 3',8-cyclase MoaA [Methanocorpusculum sp.]HJJ49617.1 GTP 3',8-cyclase MoaA [Methanocorpusculum sp.]HJJ57702.1 GTP 3',8-cyclase MoaA [Methanocorpusculum sp.]